MVSPEGLGNLHSPSGPSHPPTGWGFLEGRVHNGFLSTFQHRAKGGTLWLRRGWMDRQKKGLTTSSFPSSVSFLLPFPYRFFFFPSPDLKEWFEIIHMTHEDILFAKTCNVTEKTQVCSPLPHSSFQPLPHAREPLGPVLWEPVRTVCTCLLI